jgi:hypothetical protein
MFHVAYFLQIYGFFLYTTTIYKKNMKTDNIDNIIGFLKVYTKKDDKDNGELGEQEGGGDVATDTGASAGGAYPTVTKWETGLTRSVANQIDYKAKWKDLYKITRGKGNTLL